MRKSVVFVVLLFAVVSALGFYYLFIKDSGAPTPLGGPIGIKKKEKEKKSSPSPTHFPSKDHPHFTGPTNQYADNYFNNERVRDELHLDREELADYVSDYDRYNHYDYHDQYQDYYNEYGYDDYYYDDYYDYMYPQYSDYEWQRLNEIYSDPDVKEYLDDELNARKNDKKGKKDSRDSENMSSDRRDELNKLVNNRFGPNLSPEQKKSAFGRVNQATKDKPVEKLKKVNKKLSDPVAQKERDLKSKFKEEKKTKIESVGPNKERILDLFQAKKGEQKFYIFGTHEKEPFKEALPDTLHKKVLSNDVLITDDSSKEINEHFANEKKTELTYDKQTLEGEIARQRGKKSVVVVKALLLFGEDGLLRHLFDEGYAILRYNVSSELLKFVP